ncbi:MAG: response regulator [Betaproteobacteria bacterium]|nr:response regulator [Betaproteobacteria bacterium]
MASISPAPKPVEPAQPAAPRPIILVVDDAEDVRNLLASLFKRSYAVRLANNGAEALHLAEQVPHPDLILLDIEMPGMDGHAVCKRLKANPITRAIPVIFVTVRGGATNEAAGLRLGAVDYIEKPVSLPIVAARVQAQLAACEMRRQLEKKVAERTRELNASRLEIIHRLARAMEYREGGLTNRVARVAQYIKLLAGAAGARPEICELLMQASPLHDIGTLGVPEVVLRKTESLNAVEWEEMRTHPEVGAEIIGEHRDPVLQAARIMALTHHERWDGKGYPKGLAGEAIPWPGRALALVDAFEAMTSTQRHREPMPVSAAAKIIVAESGKQFDPKLVEAFKKALRGFIGVKKSLRDELEGIHDLNFSADAPPGG